MAPSLTVWYNILGISLHYSYLAPLTTFIYNIFRHFSLLFRFGTFHICLLQYFLSLISNIHIWHQWQVLFILFLGTSLPYSHLAPVTTVSYNISNYFSPLFILLYKAPHTTVSYNMAPASTVCNNMRGTSLHYTCLAPLTTFCYNIFWHFSPLFIFGTFHNCLLQYFLALIYNIHIWHQQQVLVILFLGTSLHYSYLAPVTTVSYKISNHFSPLFIFGTTYNC